MRAPSLVRPVLIACLAAALVAPSVLAKRNLPRDKKVFTSDFAHERCTFSDVGRNRYFVLEPGHQLKLAGEIKEGLFEVSKTVLNETRMVGDVSVRVVEERETVNGELVELSLNYYAVCQETNDVFYFGEEVELLNGGVVVSGEGSWEAGAGGAVPGLAMPSTFIVGARYYMEVAPGLAEDRVENLETGVTFDTPYGTFDNCVTTIETTPLEPGERTVKVHAEGIGAIYDDGLFLVDWTPSPWVGD